jgi:hypothetical protein
MSQTRSVTAQLLQDAARRQRTADTAALLPLLSTVTATGSLQGSQPRC